MFFAFLLVGCVHASEKENASPQEDDQHIDHDSNNESRDEDDTDVEEESEKSDDEISSPNTSDSEEGGGESEIFWQDTNQTAFSTFGDIDRDGAFQPLNPEDVRTYLHKAVDFMSDYYTNIESMPILASVKPGYLQDELRASSSTYSAPFDVTMKELRTSVVPGMMHWASVTTHHLPKALAAKRQTDKRQEIREAHPVARSSSHGPSTGTGADAPSNVK